MHRLFQWILLCVSLDPEVRVSVGERDSRKSTMNYRSNQESDTRLAPALRILCLHDAKSNAKKLGDQLEVLAQRLYEKHAVDLVFVNSPLLVSCSSNQASAESSSSSPDRIWWEEKPVQERTTTDGNEATAMSNEAGETSNEADASPPKTQFLGLDASLLLLRQVWSSMPFWGVLAVGDGAAVASFLPLLPDVHPMPAFGIFIHSHCLLEEEERLLDHWPCLHVVGTLP